jgi:TctA family transporter
MHRLHRFGTISLRLVALILAVFVLIGTLAPSADASRHRRRRNPQAGKAKAAKRIGIGAAVGAGAGGLIGGRKGALIGAGAGAGAGAAYHVHKKRSWRRRHRAR